MDGTLIALGITLLAAAVVPFTDGRPIRGVAVATLATIAWGAGMGWTIGTVSVTAMILAATLIVFFDRWHRSGRRMHARRHAASSHA